MKEGEFEKKKLLTYDRILLGNQIYFPADFLNIQLLSLLRDTIFTGVNFIPSRGKRFPSDENFYRVAKQSRSSESYRKVSLANLNVASNVFSNSASSTSDAA